LCEISFRIQNPLNKLISIQAIYRQNTTGRNSSLDAKFCSRDGAREMSWSPGLLSVIHCISTTLCGVNYRTRLLVGSLTFWSTRPTVSSIVYINDLIYNIGDRSAYDNIYAILERRNLQRRTLSVALRKSSSERQRYLTITLRWLPLHIRRFQEHQLIQLPAHCKGLVSQ
jgi:hypothetical protein